jgi:hypothetical protein
MSDDPKVHASRFILSLRLFKERNWNDPNALLPVNMDDLAMFLRWFDGRRLADQPDDALDPIIHAQHEDTGRTWMGPRSKLPRRYFEVCTDERYSEQGAADKPFV